MNLYYFMVFKDPTDVHVALYYAPSGFRSGPVKVATEESCPGMRNSSIFVAPYGRTQLYYANGNEIRLYDIYGNTSRVIYSFPDGEDITSMVFHEKDGFKLVVATYNGSRGALYTFELLNTGNLKNSTPIYSETGFGYIKKIVQKV